MSAIVEKRAAAQEVLDALTAAKLALPGSREQELDEKIKGAHAAVRVVDAEIRTHAAALHSARAGFEAEHAVAVKRVVAGTLPDLVKAIAAIDAARGVFNGVKRHCARHGFQAPDFLNALPQIEFTRKMVARLSR